MKSTGIVRYFDGLGRIAIPDEIRNALHMDVGVQVELYITKNGEIVLKKHKRTWEETVIKWWEKNYRTPNILHSDFYHMGDYTFCIVSTSRIATVAGFAKRHAEDNYNDTIGKVAAYARAMGIPINKLIGWKED